MNKGRESRIAALERRRGTDPRSMPPVEFFDRILAGQATETEWTRWTPWLMRNLPSLSDEQVERLARATANSLLAEEQHL